MIKNKFISAIFLLLTFYLYSAEQDREPVSVYYSGVKWEIQSIAQEVEQKTDLSEIGLSVLSTLLTEEKEKISSSINKSFIGMLTASGVFNISDYSNSPGIYAERLKKRHNYSVSPKITEFNITESEASGLFLKISIIITVENYIDNTEKDFSVSAIGWGRDISALITNSLSNVTSQLEYVITGFEELADNIRIKDIYQGSIVINGGKKQGIKTGDFLYSYDYHTGKKTGTFVVDRSEQNISYARILDTKVMPTAGDPLKAYNYLGIMLEANYNYFTGEFFTGNSRGAMIIWTRGLYTVNPVFGINRYDLAHIDGPKIVLLNPYAGFRIVRYIKTFTISSVVTLGGGYVSESEIYGLPLDWEYFGGTVKIEVSKRIVKHLFINLEGGYTGFLSSDYGSYPDITGFVIGGGIVFKF